MNKIIKYLTLFLILSPIDTVVYSLEEEQGGRDSSSINGRHFIVSGNCLNMEVIPLTPPTYETSEIAEQEAIKEIMDRCYSVKYGKKIDGSFYNYLSCQGIDHHKQTLVVAIGLGLLVDRPSMRAGISQQQSNGKTDFYHLFNDQAELNAPSEDFKGEVLKIFQEFHMPADHRLLTLDDFNQVPWQTLASQVLAAYNCFPPQLSIMDIFAIVCGTNQYQGWTIVNGEAITALFDCDAEAFSDYFDEQDEENPRWIQTAKHKHIVAGPVTLYDKTTCRQFPDLQANQGDLVVEYSALSPLEESYENPPLIFYLVKLKPDELKLF